MSAIAPANRFQETFGTPSDRARLKVLDTLSEDVQAFIQKAPFAILATSNAKGQCDASPKGGKPGFVKILDNKHLLLPDVAGNRLFQSYENVDTNSQVGLLFMIPGSDHTARVNGHARVVNKEELEEYKISLSVHWTDDNTKQLQGLLIEVEEAYGHCPRAFKFANLWDPETIKNNQATSV
ncbi:MAG: pyridoxamine 5'-phosphate oxidase family protein [Candidatus Latescibacteria bacterium]|nr:pyridoxamine 5'-phosphate oxidase family protein [Candidatus Latescibacterota bacterium]MBT5829462.1 pyridoxamine 5'-phosphate oxidase family protein [Candidatus Latescibacterota bacterium]